MGKFGVGIGVGPGSTEELSAKPTTRSAKPAPKDLSAREVADLPVRKAPHRVAPNLYLVRDSADGPGRWLFIYASPVLGKRVDMGLGTARDVTLRQAQTEALEYRLMVRKGRCPLSERRAADAARKAAHPTAATHTFKAVADLYIAAHRAGWKNHKHAAQWSATLETYAYPVLGHLPVNRIDTGEVMAVLEPIWRTKPETAARVRGRIETIIDYARARKWAQGENPARWRGHLDNLLPARRKVATVKHHAAVPWRELPALYQRLTQQTDVSALALRYTILTVLRTGEVLGTPAKGEIDRQHKVQTVPGTRMKAGRDHRVALSDEALAVLDQAEPMRSGAFMFNGAHVGKPLSNMALLEKLRGLYPGATTHGMRSAFRDWAAENGITRELAEAALAHVVRDRVEAAYLRGDLLEPRRVVMARWAEFLTTPTDQTNNVVVPLAEVRAAAAR